MSTKDQIDSFHEFASAQVANGGATLSMDELYCLWRAKNPTPAELASSVAAVKAAYAEMEAGDSGRPARLALRETCRRLGLVGGVVRKAVREDAGVNGDLRPRQKRID